MIEVCLTNVKTIHGLSNEQKSVIKEDLTLVNPKYVQALKHTRYSTVKIPKYLRFYNDCGSYLEVPRGYTIPFPVDKVNDLTREVVVSYPKFLLDLRDTQKEAFSHYIKDTDKGIIVLPTGKGKSILGCYIASRLRQKTLVLVHKDDLVSGWTSDAKICFGEDFEVGLIKAKNRRVGNQITIATIQTLNRLSCEELFKLTQEFGMIIVDEMHHIASSSFELLHQFDASYKLGLTATPERSDGLSPLMHFHLGDFSYIYEQTEDEKDILPVEVQIHTHNMKYTPKKTKGGKVNFHEIENAVVLDEGYQNLVCKHVIEEFKKDRSIILFLNKKDHCRAYYDALKELGIPESKMQLYYGDAKESKDVMKQRAESKEVLITIATYSIATEGTNVKQWEVAFLVSSINNEKNVEQAVGRVRRTKQGKLSTVIVHDFQLPNVAVINRHIHTRLKRYTKLNFKIVGGRRGRTLNFGGK